MSRMKQHPAAESFPMMDDKRLQELAADIHDRGQLVPCVMCDGKVLDGRNRWRACEILKIDPITTEFTGGDPWAFVWSLNGSRRDLAAGQRYLIWKHCNECSEQWQEKQRKIAEAANRKRSKTTKKRPREDGKLGKQVPGQVVPVLDDGQVGKGAKAELAGVNKGDVARGDALAASRPDLAEQVRLGEITMTEARRQAKRDAVSEKVSAIPDGKFRVIYADPPWVYNDRQAGGISDHYGPAEKHYPCMSIADICALPIKERAADESVLFLWVTSPLLPDGFKVMAAWGFKYKASFIWDKVLHNMGHYNSVRHEFLFIGTKGSCTPDQTKLFDSVQTIKRTAKHSEKPEEFRRIIETLYQHGEKLELFARSVHPGWSVFGNEL